MAKNNVVGAIRTVGLLYGIIALAGGIAIFVLFAGVPIQLLSMLPPWIGSPIVNNTPWLVSTTGSMASALAPLLAAFVFVGYGLWSLNKAFFGSADSLVTFPGLLGKGDGD